MSRFTSLSSTMSKEPCVGSMRGLLRTTALGCSPRVRCMLSAGRHTQPATAACPEVCALGQPLRAYLIPSCGVCPERAAARSAGWPLAPSWRLGLSSSFPPPSSHRAGAHLWRMNSSRISTISEKRRRLFSGLCVVRRVRCRLSEAAIRYDRRDQDRQNAQANEDQVPW